MLRRQHNWTALVITMVSLIVVATPMKVRAAEVGDKAPDFLLFSTEGETVRLSDHHGQKNVLLFFFFRAFGGV